MAVVACEAWLTETISSVGSVHVAQPTIFTESVTISWGLGVCGDKTSIRHVVGSGQRGACMRVRDNNNAFKYEWPGKVPLSDDS